MMTTVFKHFRSYVIVLVTFVCITTMLCYTAFAASATFNVKVPTGNVGVGDTFEISVEIAANGQAISSYSYEIHYDPALLSPVMGGTQTEEGVISYSSSGSDAHNMTATFKFSALAIGTASIETSATEVLSASGSSIGMTPAYNSINISEAATDSEASTDAVLSNIKSDEPQAIGEENVSDTETEEELDLTGTSSSPENTLVSLHSSNSTYYVLEKPENVSIPSAYIPVNITLNDTDVKAYMKGTSSNTVLLYAANSNGHQGWYYFNTEEGTFLNASDIIGSGASDSLSNFMSKNKFVIMLIAIIVLVVLVVVIVILAVSLKSMIADYEAQIDRMKKNLDKKDAAEKKAAEKKTEKKTEQKTNEKNTAEHIRISQPGSKGAGEVPTINNKALFPDDNTHETYADSDYDNQVSPDEDDYIHTDDYDDTAFDDIDNLEDSSDETSKDSSDASSKNNSK